MRWAGTVRRGGEDERWIGDVDSYMRGNLGSRGRRGYGRRPRQVRFRRWAPLAGVYSYKGFKVVVKLGVQKKKYGPGRIRQSGKVVHTGSKLGA